MIIRSLGAQPELNCSGWLQLQFPSVPSLLRDLSDQTGLCEFLAGPAQLRGEDGQRPQQSDGVPGGAVHGQLGRPCSSRAVRDQHWPGTDRGGEGSLEVRVEVLTVLAHGSFL